MYSLMCVDVLLFKHCGRDSWRIGLLHINTIVTKCFLLQPIRSSSSLEKNQKPCLASSHINQTNFNSSGGNQQHFEFRMPCVKQNKSKVTSTEPKVPLMTFAMAVLFLMEFLHHCISVGKKQLMQPGGVWVIQNLRASSNSISHVITVTS